MSGTLALVGGGEFSDGCSFDVGLLESSKAEEVLVLPTGAAYEHPHNLVEQAVSWFDRLGVKARGLDVLSRPDAMDPANAEVVAASRFAGDGILTRVERRVSETSPNSVGSTDSA